MIHMSLENRETIEDSLKENKNFTQISKSIGYHRTTISNEIIKHKIYMKPNTYGRSFVYCANERDCNNYHGIGCTRKCENYKPRTCEKLSKPPYVCNGCSKKTACPLQKFYYRAKEAHKMYKSDLTESRIGIRLTKEEINLINEVIVPLIKEKKQSVNQVYINHPDILYFSKTEFYNLVNANVFNLNNSDLTRKVRYKRRKNNNQKRTRKEALVRLNRTYKDYLDFIENNEDLSIVQMDTVEGTKGGKVFLTILLVQYNLMFIFLLSSKTTEEVIRVFNFIKDCLGIEEFKRIFSVILTDNGSEFLNPESIEYFNEEKICNLFFCDPNCSWQKGALEKNHEYIRYILPKKSSFNDLTQNNCNILMSHINSVPRDILKGKTPYNESLHFISKEQLEKLGIVKIEPDEVNLSSDILGDNHE